VALVAALALVASASAALPEIGRCVARAGGKYTSSTCTVPAKTGKTSLFEFEPGAVNNHFTLQAPAITMQQHNAEIGEEKISCAASKGEGVYTSPTGLEITQLELTGCQDKSAKVLCQTEAAEGNSTEGKINVPLLEGALGKTSGTKAGLLLTGTVPNPFSYGKSNLFMHYECGGKLGGRGANVFVEFGVIGELVATDRMSPTWRLRFTKSIITLDQAIRHFEGEAEEHELWENVFLAGIDDGFVNVVGVPTITNEEPLEIKSK
jgi:hypothetical protein